MFENIRKCLDEYEEIVNKVNKGEQPSKEDEAVAMYFNLHLAEALMKECGNDGIKIARIILTAIER